MPGGERISWKREHPILSNATTEKPEDEDLNVFKYIPISKLSGSQLWLQYGLVKVTGKLSLFSTWHEGG